MTQIMTSARSYNKWSVLKSFGFNLGILLNKNKITIYNLLSNIYNNIS
jgi:hypothetical protein